VILRPFNWKGAFIPFPVPINVDDISISEVTDTPQRRLCFYEGYEPLIRGALKALAREETYKGEQGVIDRLVKEGRNLQEQFRDGCEESGIAPVTWSFVRGNGNVDWEYQRHFNDLDGTPHALWLGYTAYVQLVGRQEENTSLWAGGKLDYFKCYATSSSATIEVVGHNCLDQPYYNAFQGQCDLSDIGTNTEWKDVGIGSDYGCLVFAVSASVPACLET